MYWVTKHMHRCAGSLKGRADSSASVLSSLLSSCVCCVQTQNPNPRVPICTHTRRPVRLLWLPCCSCAGAQVRAPCCCPSQNPVLSFWSACKPEPRGALVSSTHIRRAAR